LVVPSVELARLVGSWSPFSKHLIVGMFNTLRSIDATARQRESLVALGTLAAGLAHEINNPAAAVLRSVEALHATSQYMLDSLVSLAEDGVSSEQFIALDRLRVEAQGRPASDEGSLEVADREEEIGEWLESRAIDPAWSMAAVFASVDVNSDWFERVESVSGRVALGPALRWVSSTIGAANLLAEVTEATERIAHLVQDVKSYSQLDRSALQSVDLHEGLESTLSILRPKLADIEVVRVFDADLPHVEVYASELNQVWTNLIDNAADAMDGRGTLRLVTQRDGDHVVVEVVDSGPGMEPDVSARAFEPFFTTKDVGTGTGLGLDISRRIVVDRHGGDIGFESAPGSTTARVRLPISR
jgi:signal transduction histidine kinase